MHGTVRAVPVFGSNGSSGKGLLILFEYSFSRKGLFRFRFLTVPVPTVPVPLPASGKRVLTVPVSVGDGPNTVSESTVSDTELSEFFWSSRSSGERAQ